jgi:hypothetical protein
LSDKPSSFVIRQYFASQYFLFSSMLENLKNANERGKEERREKEKIIYARNDR